MTDHHTDPRVAQALSLIANVGGLLSRAERIVRTTEPRHIPRFDVVLRSLSQSQFYLAQAWNAALANVPEQKPEPPPPAAAANPEPAQSGRPAPTERTTPVHPLALRMLAEGDDRESAAVARSIRVEH